MHLEARHVSMIQAGFGALVGWFVIGEMHQRHYGWPRWSGVPVGVLVGTVAGLVQPPARSLVQLQASAVAGTRGCVGCKGYAQVIT